MAPLMRPIERLSDEIWDQAGRVAVIDVGSNTVRLVAFDIAGRVPQLVFNEKAFCGLGRNLATTGSLEPDARTLALTTIHRFVTLAERMGVVHLAMVATAAVREAADGAEFVAAVERICGVPLKIISGKADCVRHRVKAKISKFNFFVDELVAVDISSSESIS